MLCSGYKPSHGLFFSSWHTCSQGLQWHMVQASKQGLLGVVLMVEKLVWFHKMFITFRKKAFIYVRHFIWKWCCKVGNHNMLMKLKRLASWTFRNEKQKPLLNASQPSWHNHTVAIYLLTRGAWFLSFLNKILKNCVFIVKTHHEIWNQNNVDTFLLWRVTGICRLRKWTPIKTTLEHFDLIKKQKTKIT